MLKELVPAETLAPENTCGGCGNPIRDRFYLLTADRAWHGQCLRCCRCAQPLDTELSCFAREGNIYCKEDYYRLFSSRRCARCGTGLSSSELVMRARELVFHVSCFSCTLCGIPLSTGDTAGLRGGRIFCGEHFDTDLLSDSNTISGHFFPGSPQKGRPRKKKQTAQYILNNNNNNNNNLNSNNNISNNNNNNNNINNNNNNSSSNNSNQLQNQQHTQNLLQNHQSILLHTENENIGRATPMRLELLHSELQGPNSLDLSSYDGSQSPGSGGSLTPQTRTKRMRTSFKHHQLRTMKSYFAINQNPDAKDLKQLAQKTGLSKRVLQVWFQNARAKWRRNVMRQEGQLTGNPNGALTSSNNSSAISQLQQNMTSLSSGGPPSVQSSNSNLDSTTGGMTPSHSLEEMHHMTFAELY